MSLYPFIIFFYFKIFVIFYLAEEKVLGTQEFARLVGDQLYRLLWNPRPMTLGEKILCHNALGLQQPQVKSGDVIVVNVARTLASEMTWVGMEGTWRDIGNPPIWNKSRFWLAVDHTADPRNYHVPIVSRLFEKKQKK